MNAEIPIDWQVVELGRHLKTVQYGLSLKGGATGRVPILRMNCQIAGRVSFSNLQFVDTDDATLAAYRLHRGDVLFNRTNSFELVGRTALFDSEREAVFASYLLRLRFDDEQVDSTFINFLLNSNEAQQRLKLLAARAVSQANINATKLRTFEVALPPLPEQHRIAAVLEKVQRAVELEAAQERAARELKHAVMSQLFTRGLRSEPLRDTPLGLLPKSWEVKTLDTWCDVENSSLSYSDLQSLEQVADGTPVHGVKVSDMNLEGNEREFVSANLEKLVASKTAVSKTIPPGAVVFPKRGAAIATNKKRITTRWTVLDPNLIAVVAGEEIKSGYLFYWFQNFDLAKIVEPGPTPQLNKKNIEPLLFPKPSPDEQREIAAILVAIDRKAAAHAAKKKALGDLFRTTLHALMTARLRVPEDAVLTANNG